MLTYRKECDHTAVREGYRSLLKADAELCLPEERERMCEYYRRVGEACVKWAETAEGERLRAQYLALEDNRERARFQTAQYRLVCAPVWEQAPHVAYLCHSVLQIGGQKTERFMAQVWNTDEQTLLPMGQILKLFPKASPKRPPFRPDGVYPAREELVFYRNSNGEIPYAEFRIPLNT